MKYTIAAVLSVISLGLASGADLDFPEEIKQIVLEMHDKCQAETGVESVVLQQARKGNFADDPKLKCFLKCMFQGLQAMGEDGSVDLDLIEASLPGKLIENGAIDAIKQCLPAKGADLCQGAYDMIICINKVNPVLSQLFE